MGNCVGRGKIKPLSELAADSSAYHAVVFPGGFGAAKNLSTFAVDGPNMQVDRDVQAVVQAFHQAKKPIGMACIRFAPRCIYN
jgi:enhancing lycopene biosynthesis protein 2